jgi:hypothetical protein
MVFMNLSTSDRHGRATVVSRPCLTSASSASVTILEIKGETSGKLRRSRKGPLHAVSVM